MNLRKRYGRFGRWVLDGLDLIVPAGRLTALVGPNGAGKSTLIRTWMGFERPSSGNVWIDGIDPWQNRRAAISRVGYVPQVTSLYGDLTVHDHLRLAWALRDGFSLSAAANRLDNIGIALRQRVRNLSGGEQAQLSLAIALATGAPVLLLDEPLSSLDPLARREFISLLVQSIHLEGRTALISSHAVNEIAPSCDYLVLIARGQVILSGLTDELIAGHSIANPDDAPPTASIAIYQDWTGSSSVLVHGPVANGRSPASLDDVVVGYLAAARGTFGTFARAREARDRLAAIARPGPASAQQQTTDRNAAHKSAHRRPTGNETLDHEPKRTRCRHSVGAVRRSIRPSQSATGLAWGAPWPCRPSAVTEFLKGDQGQRPRRARA